MSLSERLRPNSEAAPWVIEEVKKLEERIRGLEEGYDITRRELGLGPCEMVLEGAQRLIAEKAAEAYRYQLERDAAFVVANGDIAKYEKLKRLAWWVTTWDRGAKYAQTLALNGYCQMRRRFAIERLHRALTKHR